MTAPDLDTAKLADLLAAATDGPWRVDGPVWNQIIWSGEENRMCFMAHTSGLDDDRDIANAALIALAREVIRLRAFVEEVRDYKPSVISGRAHDPQDDVADMMPLGEFESFQADAVDLVGKKVTK